MSLLSPFHFFLFQERCEKCNQSYDDNYEKWCKKCQIKYFKENFTNWTSGNEKIDEFIQGKQLNINNYKDIIFEWIPYDKFIDIKEIGKYDSATIHLAKWNGPLLWVSFNKEYKRILHSCQVILKCLYTSYNNTNEFLNEIYEAHKHLPIYGISQNLVTKNYFMVLDIHYLDYCMKCDKLYIDKWCKKCQINNFKENFASWTSGNENVDKFIQEIQLNINNHKDIIFEWIPYNQFDNIKEIGKHDFATIYSAKWKDGPLSWYSDYKIYEKRYYSYKEVVLKCLHNSITNEFLNEIYREDKHSPIYGMSRNPDTKDYIIVLDIEYYCVECGKLYTDCYKKWCKQCQVNNFRGRFSNWTSGNEKVDKFIQEKQLNINNHKDIIFKWIPYSQLNNIKEIGKYDFITIYSAEWKDGPLSWCSDYKKYEKKFDYSYEEVVLKCLHISYNNITNEFLNEIYEAHKHLPIYGMSQNPDTKDYIMVLDITYDVKSLCIKCCKLYTDGYQKWCKQCQINNLKENFVNWTSENERINEFIQRMQLNINNCEDIIFEWIPYSQFYNVKEIGKYDFATIYSAEWKDGPLYWHNLNKEYTRNSYERVVLECLHISHNSITDEFLNEIYEANKRHSKLMYGISQNQNTEQYMLVFNREYSVSNNKYMEYFKKYCLVCCKLYTNIQHKWCKLCKTNSLEKNFVNWTSGNENIDNFIQTMQLKNCDYNNILFEWIPYDQFKNVKEIDRGGFSIVYSAKWKDGPICYNQNERKNLNRSVALKSLNDSSNIGDEFLKEVQNYSIEMNHTSKSSNILKIYGMSRNPKTKDYIMVLEYVNGGNIDKYWIKKNYKSFNWKNKIITLYDIIKGLKEIHQKNIIHCDFHTGNILYDPSHNKVYISDMGLCKEVNNTVKTNIYGVMPYVAPELLRGKPSTQAADIYSFGMIMYFIATGRQPFENRAYDHHLALDICNGIRPKINEPEAPKCYIDLMKRCWDSNPDKRPNAIDLEKEIKPYKYEIESKFKEAEKYRNTNDDNLSATHSQSYLYFSVT
ncbi:hypothetical protein RclHR1_00290010 [Rhizophagus clarus]|uniref:Protein kinase domain-containing protein n=1 Tax=Rhizophagus clarus TaxID=94130 RepID=A0A2Z6R7W0_9GLOM|nr:hypothetical protein RclHR1_00290010 [Rhizophagus clarus]